MCVLIVTSLSLSLLFLFLSLSLIMLNRFDRYHFLQEEFTKKVPKNNGNNEKSGSDNNNNNSDNKDNDGCELVLFNKAIGNEGADLIAMYLSRPEEEEHYKHHTVIRLWSSRIHNEGALSLGRALLVNRTLRVLDLRVNAIGDEGAMGIAAALRVNTALERLVLRRNRIGNDGANAIGQALCPNNNNNNTNSNTTLQQLDLGNNPGITNIHALAQAVSTHPSLSGLRLSFNRIDTQGGLALAKALCHNNNTLERLYLGHNHSMGPQAGLALADALQHYHTRLVDLSLHGSHSSTMKRIEFYLHVNRLGLRKLYHQECAFALWPHALSARQTTPQHVFWLLQNRPDIIPKATTRTQRNNNDSRAPENLVNNEQQQPCCSSCCQQQEKEDSVDESSTIGHGRPPPQEQDTTPTLSLDGLCV